VFEAKKEFMSEAIRQARRAQRSGEYAVGAVIVDGNRIVAASGNRGRRDDHSFAHAEIVVVLSASKKKGTRNLAGCVLYTTHEPCPMCASLCVFARLSGIVCGARLEDMKKHAKRGRESGYLWRTIDIPAQKVLSKSSQQIRLIKDFMRDECVKLFSIT